MNTGTVVLIGIGGVVVGYMLKRCPVAVAPTSSAPWWQQVITGGLGIVDAADGKTGNLWDQIGGLFDRDDKEADKVANGGSAPGDIGWDFDFKL